MNFYLGESGHRTFSYKAFGEVKNSMKLYAQKFMIHLVE